MIVGFGSRRPQARRTFVAIAAACALAPGSAAAMSAPEQAPNLSPRLAELAQPGLRAASPARQAARLALAPSGPGSLLRDGDRVLLDVRFGRGGVGVNALRAAGAEIVHVARRYRTATVAVRPANLPALGKLAGVAGVTEVLAPVARGADCGGSFRSEGDVQLRAADARAGFALDGSGVTVGILSDSFDRDSTAATHAGGDVASGDLPGLGSPCGSSAPVSVLDDSAPTVFGPLSDEGRAMAQIVHDLAPGADLSFATAFTGELAFAANIRALAAAGAEVIVDDVSYFQEPFFQDGPVAVAVDEVAASGVSYFSAAGNDNLIDAEGRDIASWEAPAFRNSGACPAAIVELSEAREEEEIEEAEEESETPDPVGLHPENCMDFDPAATTDETFGIVVEAGEELTVDLQWAEPWNGVDTDFDAFLLDDEGKLLPGFPFGGAKDNVGVTQRPFEFLTWENEGPEREVRLVVNRFSGAEPRLKVGLLENGRGVSATEFPESLEGDVVGPTVFGHAAAGGAIAAAAVRYNDATKPEAFSSRGPVKHYFGPVAGAGAAAPTVEQAIAKPDLAATDAGANTFFGRFLAGTWRFFGTSSAAPHAAAVAALIHQANPAAGPAQIRAALSTTADPIGAFGPTAVGAGLVDAFGAVAALALAPTVAITKAPEPLSRNRLPAIEFSANRPVAFGCQVDGGTPQPCASPFVVPAPLADGVHGIAVSGVDLAGRSASSGSAFFEIDTTAPRTTIARHPPKLIRTERRRVRGVFRFRSNEADVAFACKVDRGLLRFCGSRISRRFGAGKHVVQVRAHDRAGNVDPTPAVFRFRVERTG